MHLAAASGSQALAALTGVALPGLLLYIIGIATSDIHSCAHKGAGLLAFLKNCPCTCPFPRF